MNSFPPSPPQESLSSQEVRAKRRPRSTSTPSTTAPCPNPGSWPSPSAGPCRRPLSEPGGVIKRTRSLPPSNSSKEQRYFLNVCPPLLFPACKPNCHASPAALLTGEQSGLSGEIRRGWELRRGWSARLRLLPCLLRTLTLSASTKFNTTSHRSCGDALTKALNTVLKCQRL